VRSGSIGLVNPRTAILEHLHVIREESQLQGAPVVGDNRAFIAGRKENKGMVAIV
jgi:hypothetical protein